MPKAETSRRIDIELYPNTVDANRSSANDTALHLMRKAEELEEQSMEMYASAGRGDARNLPTGVNVFSGEVTTITKLPSAMSEHTEKKLAAARGDAASSSQEEKRK